MATPYGQVMCWLRSRLIDRDLEVDEVELNERQRALRDKFIETRGYWNPFWDGLLGLDPEFFDSYIAFSSVPWKTGPVAPKIRELIYTGIDASTTHLYEPGLRQHIRNALGYGATKEELMEVLELTSLLGIHTCTMGVPVLLEELAATLAPSS
jgi:alkylhydroperoxidase/carboxymuconolactone decarboxylase family protein YurZ